MLGRITRIASISSVFLAAALTATPSEAVPAFARQTGKACSTCHFQHYPALNDYGQEFKASGYTQLGKQAEVKGDGISLPGILNASLFVKARYQKSSGSDGVDVNGQAVKTTNSGEFQFPDEFALLLGGRVTENIGFLVESQYASDGGVNFLAGFKMPMMYPVGETMKAGVIPFLTDGLGASYGFELLSTGAVRNQRVSENRNETSAHQYVFFNTTGPRTLETDPTGVFTQTVNDPVTGAALRDPAGAASGLAFALWDPQFHVAYTQWTPHHLPMAGSNVGGLEAGLLRAVWTPTFGEWALGVGVQSYTGSGMRYARGDGTVFYVNTKGTAFDVQAQGAVGGMPLGVYFTHATAPGQATTTAAADIVGNTAATAQNLFNPNPNARKATVITAELGVLPSKATVVVAYRDADNGALTNSDDSGWTLGGTYQLAQNVQLQLNHSTRTGATGRYGSHIGGASGTTGGSSMTTFMLSAGF